QPATEQEALSVRKMNHYLTHRGPDDAGFFKGRRVCFAVSRLSIIDTQNGSQPIYNEDNTLVLVFNGEIYNYKALRKDLIEKGHRFKTGADSETIVHLYEEYGTACLSRLRGMFTIALYDRVKKTVLIARDRLGEKPLYVCEKDSGIFFASEIKALIKSGIAPPEIDHKALHYYFHYRYIPDPMTPLAKVKKLEPAHYMTISLAPWEIKTGCYWRMEDLPPVWGNPVQLFRDTLEDISAGITQCDVPLGIALSGGLDSSAIACLLSERGHPFHAVSVGYEGSHYHDERKDARALASHLKAPFTEVAVNTNEMAETFADTVYHRDDPISDISGYSYYTVMETARKQGIKVMLQGQGGDELFLSYDWVIRALNNSRLKNRLTGRPNIVNCMDIHLPDHLSLRSLKSWMTDLGGLCSGLETYRNLKTLPRNQLEFYNLEKMYKHNLNHAGNMYTRRFSDRIKGINVNDCFTYDRPWGNVDILIMSSLFKTYLLQNGITQGDRLSMAASVELRLPFVDYRLMELMVGLRKAGADIGNRPKELLKTSLSDILPAFVLNRPKKGFSPPVKSWVKAIHRKYKDFLSDGFLTGHAIIDEPYIKKHFLPGPPASVRSRNDFMKVLVLELWFRRMTE
ncbi:MAG: asparagine synthase (glutamine-hydrolyzing), partial [Desulfobacterales bacterium]|nr:asparagine synthase (glutamine-hydrolyzing) [Desulfobacterales bacterium]